MIHGHGDDFYQSARPIRANFSTNVWYEADTRLLQKVLEEKMDTIFHYPEPDAASFRQVAAQYHGVPPECVLAGNGATELFYLVAHAFAGSFTLLPIPSFREYEDACKLYDHHIQFLLCPDILHLPPDAGLMFICNPNNPDGKIWTEEELRTLLETYSDMMLVVDESFIHFAPEAHSAVDLLPSYPNLLIIRSMTKCFAIPGLRLGYMLGDPHIIEFIGCFQHPWSVNALAVEAGKYLLQCETNALPDAARLLQRQRAFAARIADIPGFRPLESHTSFFLIETRFDSGLLKKYLLDQHGILIRDAANFRGLDNHYFRINILTDEKNEMLLQALKNYNVY